MPASVGSALPAVAELNLSSTQLAFVQDSHRYAAFVGGVGSGKSYAGAAKVILQENGAGLGLVVAPTYAMLRDATWRSCLELWTPWIAEVRRQEMKIALRTGGEVLFRSADEPDRLRGINASWAWIDEAATTPPDTWQIVIGRLREGGAAGRCWITTTPKGMNWVHEVFVLKASDDTALYTASTASNPFLDEAFVTALGEQYASDFAAQELEGRFVTLGAGLIKRQWFRVAEVAPEGLRWVRAWDLATSEKLSADYTASARVARDGEGRLWVADMIRGRWAWPDARRIILSTMMLESAEVVVEAAGFQLAAVQDLLRQPEAGRRAIRGVQVDRDKLSRAQPWIARAEAGLMTLVRGGWVPDFLEEAANFPAGAHDDQVDAVSLAVAQLTARRTWGGHS